MDTWDIVILVIAGYAAVLSLVRLMIRQRDRMLGDFRQQMAAEKLRKEAVAKRTQRQERGKAA